MSRYRFQLRRGWKNTATGRNDWVEYETQEDHIKPDEGELVLEYDDGVPRLKIGDGFSEFSQLPYMSVDSFILPTSASVTLEANKWSPVVDENTNEVIPNRYAQEAVVDNATVYSNSRVDLKLSPEQLVIFREKDIAFTTVNKRGNLRVCVVGQQPTNEYTIQVDIIPVDGDPDVIYGSTVATTIKPGGGNGGDISGDVATRLNAIESQLADLVYQAISITSFSHNAGTKEIGQTVSSVTLSWSTNKIPTTLTLNGENIANVSQKSITLTGLSITSNNNTTWTLKATDDRGATSTKQTSITFYNGVYYGVASEDPSVYDSSFVRGFTKSLQGSRAKQFTVTPQTQYVYYCSPVRLGTCSFTVGGFAGGFESPKTISFTNASGYTENYYIYRSTNKVTGSKTVSVT